MKPLVLLISPPIYDFALFDLFLKPYSLLSLGRSFEKSGYRVKCINSLDYTDAVSKRELGRPRRYANGTGKFFRQPARKPSLFSPIKRQYARYGITSKVLSQKIGQEKPDIVLVSTGMTYWYPGVHESVQLVRILHRNVPVIAGGIYATLCTDHCKKTMEVDSVIKGNAFPGLVPVLKKLSLPVPCENNDTDILMLPDIYSDAGVIRLNKGCPFRCHYCASSSVSGNFTKGNPWKSFSLLEKIHQKMGTEVFAFYDDALLCGKEEIFIPFLEMIIKSDLHLSFYLPNGIHLQYLDMKTAVFMKQAGFKEVRIGLESADDYFHHTMDRKLDIKILEEKINLLTHAGFKPWEIGLYIMAGLPGQRKNEVVESVRFASRFGVRISIAEYSPVPQSPLWEESVRLSRYPLETEPLTHNNTILPMEWEYFTLSDLDEIKTLAHSLSPLRS
ncbi:MAG: radical SAM protein [Spirochaetales bacterium]|nr:radical SAM protein [Spirochaetales bacterium]